MENVIAQYLNKHGLTASEAARRAGLEPSTVWRHAKGKSGVSAEAAVAYNKAFKLSLAKLLAIKGDRGAA